MKLENCFQRYAEARWPPLGQRRHKIEFSKKEILVLQNPTSEEEAWILLALTDERKKWCVAALADEVGSLAKRFRVPFLEAAIAERNPSFNRQFVEPCIKSFPAHTVIDYLLSRVEEGKNIVISGAVNALYWAFVLLREDTKGKNELLDRKRMLMLETFVNNDDLNVRRSIVPSLNLDPRVYSTDMSRLIKRAVKIARRSSDEYIRHRIEIQLGGSGPYMALPHREE